MCCPSCTPEEIMELNRRLEPYKEKGQFLPFEKLRDLFDEYEVIVGAAHPFRAGGKYPLPSGGSASPF